MPNLTHLFKKLTTYGTLRYDAHGIHRSWKYNPHNSTEREAIQQFANYATNHNIPQYKLNVWTNNNYIHHNIRQFMHSPIKERYTHYLIHPEAFHQSNTTNTFWSITFHEAKKPQPRPPLPMPLLPKQYLRVL